MRWRKLASEGVITVEEGKGLENELDVVEGMQFDRGYLSPYFINNQDSMSAELEDPYILIVRQEDLQYSRSCLPILESGCQSWQVPDGRSPRISKEKHWRHWW